MAARLLASTSTTASKWGRTISGRRHRSLTDWIDSNDQRIRKQEDDLAHWWSVLDDPALDALVADAYRQNLTLRDAGFRVLQARALLGVSIGNFFPQQQYMQGDALRNALSQKAANRSFLTKRFYNQWDLGFGLAWELDFWGRFRRAIEAADADLNASVEFYDDVLVTLLGDVAQAYVNIRIYEQQILLTRANVELQRETLKLVTARFEGGQVSELDVDQAQSLLSQTEAQIPVLEISLRTANNQLCVLMGRPMINLEPLVGPENIPTAPTEIAVGIPADLLRRRPDVREPSGWRPARQPGSAWPCPIGIPIFRSWGRSIIRPRISNICSRDAQSRGTSAQASSGTCSTMAAS